ncbi:MAG: hypothetical protein WB711_06160 [Terriglobales bacterium]
MQTVRVSKCKKTGADAVAEVTRAAPPIKPGQSSLTRAVAVSPVRSSGHPHGERQQFDNQVVENASN